MKKALVTGASGFIACHLIAELERCDWQVTGVDSRAAQAADLRPYLVADIRDAQVMGELFERESPDVVFNMAGVLARQKGPTALRVAMDVNLGGAITVLRAAVGAGVKRVVLMGSAEELGDQPGPHTEDMEPRPLSPYGISKAGMTWMALAMHRESRAPVVVMRPSTVYGPGQPEALFVSQAVRAAVGGERFEMSAGKQRRDMVFVSDMARALVAAATAPNVDGEIITIAAGTAYALRDVAKRIWELSGSSAELSIGQRPASGAELADTWGDPSKASRLLDWSVRVGLDDGLRATIEAVRN